jgi:hypothetical protein
VSGIPVAIAPCWMCKVPFSFHPDLVTSVLIDPVTGRPPDLGGDPDRAVREPLCPSCCKIANARRRLSGLELLDERDSLDRLEDTW